MSEELKPCPFCGGKADGEINPKGYASISCSNRGCVLFYELVGGKEWQSRPIEDALRAELDAARAEAEDYRKVLTDFANKKNWLWSDPFGGHQPYWLLNAGYASSSAVLAKYKKDGDA